MATGKLKAVSQEENIDLQQHRLIGQSEGKIDIIIGMLEAQNKRLTEVERKVNLVFSFFKDPKKVLGAVFMGGSGYAGMGWVLELFGA